LAAWAILTYHSLDDTGSVISTCPEVFRRQMEKLASSGIPVVPLTRILETPGAVALTFDDAYCNFLEHGVPVLEQHRFPATVFVVSGRCGGLNEWSHPYARTPRLELMSWSELEQLGSSGITLGAHTVSHPNLARLPEEEATREMRDCRRQLEDRTGQVVETLAYPYGISTPAVRQAARREFRVACSTALRYLRPGDDPWNLPRIDAYYLRSRVWFNQLMKPGGRAYILARRWLRELRARLAQGSAS
jgi:peptidoglycan/xylan/chitin deacetylase (PgdA/CDA1 family)